MYQGGGDRLMALDTQGRRLWTYEDSSMSPNLAVLRTVSPRALTTDGRILLASASGDKNAAPSILGLDSATGKVLWQRTGIPLSKGKVIPANDRFIVMADDHTAHELLAADGREGTAMSALTGSPDTVIPLPGRDSLLIAENDHFNRNGPSARVYIRSLKGAPDQDLKVPGRVRVASLMPDNQSFIIVSSRNRTLRFALDGTVIWDVQTPAGGNVRFSPDNKTIVISGADGAIHMLNTADGKLKRSVDLNFGNNITAENFVKQELMGDVPTEAGRAIPLPPVEPSYVKSLSDKTIKFGPNLATPEQMRALLKPVEPAAPGSADVGYLGKLTTPVKLPPFKVSAGVTYLVEMLTMSADPTNASPLLRVEVAVKGKMTTKNMPYTARLPVDANLTRFRAAFRSDEDDEVTLTLQAVLPQSAGGRGALTYDNAKASGTSAVIGDVVVSPMTFPGPNVLFDGGPGARSKPAGSFTCTVFPAPDDNSASAKVGNIDCTDAALRLVNGQIANQKTDWLKTKGAYGPNQLNYQVEHAEANAGLTTPKAIAAIAIFEDNTGPVVDSGSRTLERTAMRYCVEVRDTAGNWVRVGAVHENRQLVNIFPCPPSKINGIRFVWAGANDDKEGRTDGFVRSAQIEAYASENIITTIESILNKAENDLPPPSDGF